ncbi:TetR/AcrR family transcriptional regulator [Croceicoccus sediminis]|uniref:TetR/AcrR family transcriptional regulator n=1 Tax=Croceicoccus sediminis TaxID=2571150 RepID=UPI001183C3FB|nr:TetR/AcrR family transcriptional regulator [Croceicoccus sediminis]
MTEVSPFRTAEQKEAERAAKRDAVLSAAARMFNERGFANTSLDDVAARLGISKRTIYHYYPTKDQVLLACLKKGMGQLRDAADDARGRDGDGLARLEYYLRRYAVISMEDFGRCVIRTGVEELKPESLAEYRVLKRDMDAAVQAMLHAAVEDGSIACENEKLAVFALAGALNWPARWHDPEGALSREEIADQLVEFLMRGLRPRT